MKKGMFNEKYGLTKAVLEGRKTNTRRICKNQVNPTIEEAKWKVGEIIAVAQSYFDCGYSVRHPRYESIAESNIQFSDGSAGWDNKMFVRADLMPHRIKITNVRVERLQDISEEDCMKEGVQLSGFDWACDRYFVEGIKRKGNTIICTNEKRSQYSIPMADIR